MKQVLDLSEGESLSFSFETIYANNMPKCHAHECYELYFLISGARYLFVGNRFYSVRAGDVFLIKPGVEHRTLDSSGGEYSRLAVMIPRGLIPSDAIPEGDIHFARPDEKHRAVLYSETERLKRLGDSKERGGGIRVMISVLNILSILVSEPHLELTEGASPSIERMEEILRYIDSHFTERITLSSLSERFFISEYYLCRLFKEHTGRSFLEYLNELRIRRAVSLISSGERRIAELRRHSGFGSDSAFCKAFKRGVGCSVREYAASLQKRK